MIESFAGRDAERIWKGKFSKHIEPIKSVAFRKLAMVHAAHALDDLKSPPGNRLEALQGARKGQHSIRINDQFRVCFVWRDGNAYNVEIVDYH